MGWKLADGQGLDAFLEHRSLIFALKNRAPMVDEQQMTDTKQLDDGAYEDGDLDEADDDLDTWEAFETEDELDVDYEDFLDWLNRRS